MDDGTLAQPFVHERRTSSDAVDTVDTADAADAGIALEMDAVASGAASYAGAFAPLAVASQFSTWIRLIRPSALLLVLTPALTALALLWLRGARLLPLPALAGIVSLLLLQAGASLLDVYLEYARRARIPEPDWRDQLTARALLARSTIHPLNVLRLSILLMALGALAGIPLVATGGLPVVVLGVAGIAIAFLFSATSYALKQYSLADIIIGLALGPGIVIGMILAQRHTPTPRDLLIAGALGLLAMLPAEGAHLRDPQQDALLHRKTLVTLLGDRVGRAVYALCLLLGMALLALAALPPGAPHGALLAFLALPSFAVPVSGALLAGPGHARDQVVLQELRAYAIFAFWLLLGLALNAIVVRGLGPIAPLV